jgi:uncharacterized protein YkwD
VPDLRNSLAALTLLALLCGLALVSAGGAAASSPDAFASSGPALRAAERTVLDLLNAQRAGHGLRPLRRSAPLDRAAAFQSHDMVRHRYFAHERHGGPSLVRRVRRTGYLRGAHRWVVGENIEWASGAFASPDSLVAGWMARHDHRKNILDRRFRNIGIGSTRGAPDPGGGGVTMTTDFGFRS